MACVDEKLYSLNNPAVIIIEKGSDMLNFMELNFIAILIAAIAKFMIGVLWFSGLLFGKLWMAEVGLKVENLTSPRNPMIIAFLCNLLFAFTVAVIFSLLSLDFLGAVTIAVIIAIGISAAQMAPSFAFEGRSLKLFLIYATLYVTEFVAVACILTLLN